MFGWRKKMGTGEKKNQKAQGGDQRDHILSTQLEHNLNSVKQAFENASDITIRRFQIASNPPVNAFIVFVDGIVDRTAAYETVLQPLMSAQALKDQVRGQKGAKLLGLLQQQVLPAINARQIARFGEVIDSVLTGDLALFIEGAEQALLLGVRGWEMRGVEEPDTEAVVRGPREGFTETLRTNTAQLRRRIRTPDLKFETMQLGTQTKTDVCLTYIKGIANDKVVQEVKRRLSDIKTDSVLESGYIEQYIEDAPFSFFPTVGNSEKPDVVAGKLLEGRVAIFTDGTPFVLTVPYLFVEAFQSSEDYYSRPYFATMIRWIRYVAFLLSILSPAVYVAITAFHQELLPPALLVTIASAREGSPFPAVVEAIGMGLVFEILREAGVRLPRPIGQAVSIVGALVIGDAAVSAGLVGAPMVIVVAITAIASFVVPAVTDATTIMRFFLALAAGFLGAYGILLGLALILTHSVSLRSFGSPYLSPIAPLTVSDLKDVAIRAPWWAMASRPRVLAKQDSKRQRFRINPPQPLEGGGTDE